MGEPVLVNSNLDAMISSDNYRQGSGVIRRNEEMTEITENVDVKVKKDFATYTELNVGRVGPRKMTSHMESTVVSKQPISDAAAASFGQPTLEMIIDNDDRKEVPDATLSPWRKIAALIITSQNGTQYAGTAWFISQRILITAGHCVFLHDAGDFAKTIEVIPAWHDNIKPFGSYTATRFQSSNGWVNDRNSDYDYGVIILDEDANSDIGWFAFAAAPDDYLNEKIVNVCGYPHDQGKWGNQYYHARAITRSSKHKVYYDADSTGGQSGAALWLTLGESERVAIGIHTTGSSTTNSGTRITNPMYENFKNIRNEYQ
jgi:V8-like Glu-specific endopeptidase